MGQHQPNGAPQRKERPSLSFQLFFSLSLSLFSLSLSLSLNLSLAAFSLHCGMMCGFCLHHLQPCYQYFLRLFPPRVISLPSVSLMNSRFLPPSFRPLSCFNLPLITLSSTSIFHWPNPPSLVATSLSLSPCHTLLMSLLSSHRYRFSILFISLTHCLSVTSSPYSTHVPSGIISSPYSSYVPP